ncbi:hypothetical protein cypCar_00029005, partial [Cyprinus carpio]
PDRGAKRPRDEGSREESRSRQKTAGRDARRAPVRSEADGEEQTADREKILERLMDQDTEDPEFGGQVVALMVQTWSVWTRGEGGSLIGVYTTFKGSNGSNLRSSLLSAVIENMAEFRPGLCTEAAQQGLMQWLLKRIKAKMPFDANKLYCSEILAILLQNNDKTRELLGEMDGIDVLLQQLSKKMSRVSALKVLDYGVIGPEGSDNCHKFVDILGLRTIFPLFMKTPKKMKKVGVSDKEHEEHVCSIIASMLRNLKGQQRSRLLSKFTENDCEKVDRLMELHFKYLEAVQLADKRIEGEKHDMVRRGEIIDDAMDDEFYLRRLDAGLFVLQLVCYIMVEICNAGVPQLQQRVHQILNLRGGSVKIVRHIMREYAENIGDGKSEEFKESEQKRILELLENF